MKVYFEAIVVKTQTPFKINVILNLLKPFNRNYCLTINSYLKSPDQ